MLKSQLFTGYIGTYTKGESEGIYSFTWNPQEKSISIDKVAANLEDPTYLTVNEDESFLYAVMKEAKSGGVASYKINSDTSELTLINSQLLAGASPCHVSLANNHHRLVTANYGKGTVESYFVDNNGSIQPPASIVNHKGSGPNKQRQEGPHVHYAGFSPDEKYVVVVDLGNDTVKTYHDLDGILQEASNLAVKAGSGPRHLTFHPNGKYAYVMTELSSEVIVLEYHEDSGGFTELDYISTIPADFTENNQGSAIHISADGGFVYATNRGHNSIAIFSVDQMSGTPNICR